MAGRKLSASDVPTPGPWIVRGEADAEATALATMLGIEPAQNDRPGGWPYFIRRDQLIEPGGSSLHIATGIQRQADAKLIAAAPELTATLLRLLTTSALMAHDRDARTGEAVIAGWELLVRVAPHLEVGP